MVPPVTVSSNRLRVLRAEKGITQTNVARHVLRINTFRSWQIEHGYTQPRRHEIRKLAQFFGVDAAAIFPHLATEALEKAAAR